MHDAAKCSVEQAASSFADTPAKASCSSEFSRGSTTNRKSRTVSSRTRVVSTDLTAIQPHVGQKMSCVEPNTHPFRLTALISQDPPSQTRVASSFLQFCLFRTLLQLAKNAISPKQDPLLSSVRTLSPSTAWAQPTSKKNWMHTQKRQNIEVAQLVYHGDVSTALQAVARQEEICTTLVPMVPLRMMISPFLCVLTVCRDVRFG